jgi:hypothetical protein
VAQGRVGCNPGAEERRGPSEIEVGGDAQNEVFIDDDAPLEAVYGERVPVLRDDTAGRELDWPFDVDSLRAWIQAA